jgi:hypothetical protein
MVDGEADAVLEFGDAPRMAGDAPLARGPVAGRQVEQHDLQARGQHHFGQRRAVVLVGKMEFDGGKAGRSAPRQSARKKDAR